MRELPECSVDLVVTSPPYNLRNSSGGWAKGGKQKSRWKNAKIKEGYANHNDCMPHGDYVKWQRECLSEMFRPIKDTGAIFYVHKWRVQNGIMQDRDDIVAGFPVRQIIIWQRKGGINFNDTYFVPTYEVIYLIAKPTFRLVRGANGLGDVWEITQEKNNDHPAPFPL
jgi:modification methylase